MSGTSLICAGILVALVGGALAALSARTACRGAVCLGVSLLSCTLALAGALQVLAGGEPGEIRLPWSVPGGSLTLRLDDLGAWFALVVALVGAPVAVYANSYFRNAVSSAYGTFAFFFHSLLALLWLLAAARSALLFLAGWEAMTLCAYLLVVLKHTDATVRGAGRLYLFANHTAAFCVMLLICILGTGAGSFDLDAIAARADRGPRTPLIILALVGFGTKAGALPFHIWLPHAHPAAPSPISALLSGLVLKAGIFGLLRFLPLLSPLPAWTGHVLLLLGALSGLFGVLVAIVQPEMKRLLAYCSVENIGIILLGIGVAILGAEAGSPAVAALGFAGALLHMLNHALFKALLFLGAGSVIHAAGTGRLERLGGIARTMPQTCLLFAVGAAAVCALPPLSGFMSEWTVARALFEGAAVGTGRMHLASIAGVLALGLIGGLSAACFARAFAAAFLGEARAGAAGHEAPVRERLAMALLAALCLGVGLFPHLFLRLVWPAASALAVAIGAGEAPPVAPFGASLLWVSRAGTLLLLLALLLTLLRWRLARVRSAPVATWGCAYARPTPRMRMTSSSFASGFLAVFRRFVLLREHRVRPIGLHPAPPSVTTEAPDAAESLFYRPLYRTLVRGSALLRVLQRFPGQVQVFLVMVVLAALLLWKVGMAG